MKLVDDFENAPTDDYGYVLITEKEIADLRYFLIDSEGRARFIPLRWHSHHVHESTLIILAEFDSPIMGVTEVAVYLNYFKRVAMLEVVDADGASHYVDWPMKEDLRADLWQAVKSFALSADDTGTVHEWPKGINPADWMESL